MTLDTAAPASGLPLSMQTAAPDMAVANQSIPAIPDLTTLDAARQSGDVAMPLIQMFLDADPIVKAVMVLLFIASLVTWAIILEKTVLIKRLSAEIRDFCGSVAAMETMPPTVDFTGKGRRIATAGIEESADTAGNETRAEFRERIERSMRGALAKELDIAGRRSLFLATVAASSPFIGLFGTVWGIMHSFAGIAASGETSLAVVAPGIAEALFATALGLIAAIPAVLGYNRITASLKRVSREGLSGIAVLGNLLARRHFTNGAGSGSGAYDA